MDENRKFYFEYERRFPNHLIIQKEGIFYNAYGYSARVLSQIMQLETREVKGRISTGSTRAAIIDTLKSEDYSFIILENGYITDRHDGRFPFAAYKEKKPDALKSRETTVKLSMTPYPVNLLLRIFEEEFPELQLSLSVLSSDISPRLDYVLSSLKPRDKQMMIMRFKEEKTYQEIGDSFGMSKQAVDQHIRNAIKKLRKDPYFNLYIREEILNLVSQS